MSLQRFLARSAVALLMAGALAFGVNAMFSGIDKSYGAGRVEQVRSFR